MNTFVISMGEPIPNIFSNYKYLVPRPPDLVNMFNIDPNRLDPYKEYPRDTVIYDNNIKSNAMVDFEVSFTDSFSVSGMKVGMVCLLHNNYTIATQKKPIYKATLSCQIINKIIAEHLMKTAISHYLRSNHETH